MSPHRRYYTNEYAESCDRDFYEQTPKAVWAALAVSFCAEAKGAESIIEKRDMLTCFLAEEWELLHDNGILPYGPPEAARQAIHRVVMSQGVPQ